MEEKSVQEMVDEAGQKFMEMYSNYVMKIPFEFEEEEKKEFIIVENCYFA